ncbi:MAG: hypothetical protein CEE38_23410 [Planctomycetes bacterium B3_Pla]|nr:MAG: hypothetical protein CEE38_23410 [Planctomycetes bacterium B3_Pla]
MSGEFKGYGPFFDELCLIIIGFAKGQRFPELLRSFGTQTSPGIKCGVPGMAPAEIVDLSRIQTTHPDERTQKTQPIRNQFLNCPKSGKNARIVMVEGTVVWLVRNCQPPCLFQEQGG